MKKISKVLISLLIILISISIGVSADQSIKVSVNGQNINFDNPPIIKEGRTLVPLRKIFEALDIVVRWDDTTNTVFACKENTIISIPLNSKTATIRTDENTSKSVELDIPAQLIESRTFVPVRFIAESIGADVNWDEENRTVVITMEIKKNIQRYEFDNGYYEGEVENGQFNGYGKYVWKDGGSYEGNWLNGKFHGQGKYTYEDGAYYEGEWKNGKQNGHGKIVYADDTSYEGEFINGEIKQEASSEEPELTEYQKKALEGPSYKELMKAAHKYKGQPAYFTGEVIQAVENEDGSTFILVDTSSGANSFAEYKLLAVFSDTSVDILAEDTIQIYGDVLENYTYEANNGYTYTVPAIKLKSFKRTSYRSLFEMMDE